MEAIRRFLRLWKKIHFWVLIPIVLLVAAVGYVLASSKVWSDYDKYATTIKTMVSDASAVSSKTPHPNSEYLAGMDAMMQQRTKNVLDAWNAKAGRQEKHLTWPEQLSPVFLKAVEGRRPIEKFDPADKRSNDLHISLREEYRDLIRSVLPQLADTIGSKWHVVDTAGDGVSTLVEMEDPDSESTLVGWSRENQEQLINSRFTWSRAEAETPSTMEVMYAQEDLWVLQALMRIIKRTNEGATDRTRAVVKEIDFIRLANDVVTDAGEIEGVAASGGAAADPLAAATADPLAAAGDPATSASPLGIPGEGAGLTAAARRNPADNRYVDRDYKKLTAEELKAAVKAEDPQNAYLAVAKRIPVQMRLLVDTRRLNRFLAECANEELTVEVRQLRMGCMASEAPDSMMGGGRYGAGYGASGYGASGGYGATTPPTADGAAAGGDSAAGGAAGGGYGGTGYGAGGGYGGYGAGGDAAAMVEVYDPDHAESPGASSGTGVGGASGYGGGGRGYGGGYGGASRYGGGGYGGAARYGGGGGGGSYGGSEDASAEGKPRGRYNQYVEIMGIVYIFNPVNKTVLGVEEEGGAAEGDSSGESTEEAPAGDVAAAEPN